MKERLGYREAAGWLALGGAGMVAAAIALWLFLGGDSGSDAAGPVVPGPIDSFAPEVGKVAPDFALRDARDPGVTRKLSDYRGKTVVLNWFASWCAPCRSEMPEFENAYQALGGEAGEVVFLVVNFMEPAETAAAMLDELGVTYPAVLDSDGQVAALYRINGLPTTYFIDRDGIVRAGGGGRITEEALRAELKKLGYTY